MESCKIVDTEQIPDGMEDYMEGLVKCTSDFAKEEARSKMPDIPLDAIDDLYESHICKAVCVKSKSEYEKFRSEGYNKVESSKRALIDELLSLRDKGVLPDDIATENVIRSIKNGTASSASPRYSKSLERVLPRFRHAAGETRLKKVFIYTSYDEKEMSYYTDTISKFNMSIPQFVKEAMDLYIENNQQELREIERREDAKSKEEEDKKEDVSEKNSRLFG